MIYEWKLDGETRNFGDSLYELLLPEETIYEWEEDLFIMYSPIGSTICNEVMVEGLDLGYKPTFLSCGWRGEELDPELVDQCRFVGARGPHTAAELARCGVEVEVTGDPAYELPSIIPKGDSNALAIVFRHIKDEAEYDKQSIFEYKADAIFSPVVETESDIIDLINKISGSRFVLSGSMHAAMVADAYGVPFALLESEYIDCPPKWEDWFASRGYGDPVFVGDVFEGREWYKDAIRGLKT